MQTTTVSGIHLTFLWEILHLQLGKSGKTSLPYPFYFILGNIAFLLPTPLRNTYVGSGQVSLPSSTVRGYDRCAEGLQSTPSLQHLCTVFCERLLRAAADTCAILPAYQHIVGQPTIHPAVLRIGAQ